MARSVAYSSGCPVSARSPVMTTQSGRGSTASRRASASARAAAGWAARGPRVRWRSLRWAIRMRLKVPRTPGSMAPMIGRLHHLVIDCPDPPALAAFYAELLGQPVTYRSDDFVVVSADDTTSGLAFQLAPDHQPPAWPDPARSQQMHLDVMVEDVAAAGPRVLALGATKLDGPGVYADPAGHPFCLIPRPKWAAPDPELTPGSVRRVSSSPGAPVKPGAAWAMPCLISS